MSDELDDPPVEHFDIGAATQEDLIHIPKDWEKIWVGMPAYKQEDLEPWQSVLVHFSTPQDRRAFAELADQQIHPKTKFIWYPKMVRRTMINKRWRSDHHTPRYPIYVPTKGRWETPQTVRALEAINVAHYVVVQPQELEHYRSVVKKGQILVLPAGLDGLVPTRNWIRKHSMEMLGAKRHWQIDDNIQYFARFHQNLKYRFADGSCFCLIEDFTDRYTNIAVSGPNYDMFTRMKYDDAPPVSLNTRVYSCSLVNNEMPHWWRDVYNDDTDLCLRAMKDGWSVMQFNAYVAKKTTTMLLKGGNTGIYLGAESVWEEWQSHCKTRAICEEEVSPLVCESGRAILKRDGRWKMAESLRVQHPDVTTVERKWNRWQHQVDYRQFRKIGLVLRPDFIVPVGNDEHGLELIDIDVEDGDEVDVIEDAVEEDVIRGDDDPTPPKPKPERKVKKEKPAAESGPSAPDLLFGNVSEPALEPALETAPQTGGEQEPTTDLPTDLSAQTEPATGQPEPEETGLESASSPAPDPSVLSIFLGPSYSPPASQSTIDDWVAQEPPCLDGIDEISLNYETDGTEWAKGDRPIGVTIGTLDGQLKRFLPFGFAGGNLDEATVKRWAQRELRGKHITNANTRFDVHMSREWGVDLEEQGNTVSDVMHWAALLDDHRKLFNLDKLAADFLHDVGPQRADESRMKTYHARDVALRAEFQVEASARLRDEMWPMLDAEDLQQVRQLEDEVIYPLVEMEKNGSPLDMELLHAMSAEYKSAYGKLMMEIASEIGFAWEHKAKGWARMFEKLALPPSDSYDEEVLASIDHPLVRKATHAKELASLNSKTFAAYLKQVDSEGILRYDINQLRGDDGGTVSGRFSIGYVQQVPNHDNHHRAFSDPDTIDGCLGNCLLFPRRLFVAGKRANGERFDYLEADASQIEYRLFAHHASNPEVLAAYRQNPLMSFHKTTWEMMKRVKADMLYSHQKNFNSAKMYGARSVKLAIMMGFITEAEGKQIRAAKAWTDPRLHQIQSIEAAYKKMMPEGGALLERAAHLAMPECDDNCLDQNGHIKRHLQAIHKQLPHRGFVKTMLGRRSRFLTNYKTYIGLNRVIQGTGADIMKRKLVEVYRIRKNIGFKPRLTVHDQIGGDCQMADTKERVAEILNRQSFPELKVPILWNVKTGPNWAECK